MLHRFDDSFGLNREGSFLLVAQWLARQRGPILGDDSNTLAA